MGFLALAALALLAGGPPDISSVPADLQPPPCIEAAPVAGRRVRQSLPDFRDSDVHHTLYLPTDWQPGGRYPVLVEYAGNGGYRNAYGDVSDGTVEGSRLGYGISAGRGYLWLCLPYVNARERRNETQWWGDVDATVDYARRAVRATCEAYGGDAGAVILVGFSRGAIGCGYLGLHDDAIADVWLAFIAYSHYDGVRRWGYPGDDRTAALQRLRRLRGRASFICMEGGTAETEAYLREAGVDAPFTFAATGFRNHSDAWVLRPSPARDALRTWLAEVLRTRPGR